ncbi:MAG: hypothetical protein HY774_06645 [Acidobacteria bacterium]|nr:hypothetical protein [Acidobacteriota bacterium]
MRNIFRYGKVGFRPDGRWKVAGGLPLWAYHRISIHFIRARMGAGNVLWQGFGENPGVLGGFDPAPIRARTIGGLHSGGCASKQASHRLLSIALRAGVVKLN